MGLEGVAGHELYRGVRNDIRETFTDLSKIGNESKKVEAWAVETSKDILPKQQERVKELSTRKPLQEQDLNTYRRLGLEFKLMAGHSELLKYNREKVQGLVKHLEDATNALKANVTLAKVNEFINGYSELAKNETGKPDFENPKSVGNEALFTDVHKEMKTQVEAHNKGIAATLNSATALVTKSGANLDDKDDEQVEAQRTKWAQKHQKLRTDLQTAEELLKTLSAAQIGDTVFSNGAPAAFEKFLTGTTAKIATAQIATEKLRGELKTWKSEVETQAAELKANLATAATNIGIDKSGPGILTRIGILSDPVEAFVNQHKTLTELAEQYTPNTEDAVVQKEKIQKNLALLTTGYNGLPVEARATHKENLDTVTAAVNKVLSGPSWAEQKAANAKELAVVLGKKVGLVGDPEANFIKNAVILKESLASFSKEKGMMDETRKGSLRDTLASLNEMFEALTKEQKLVHQAEMTDLKSQTTKITDPNTGFFSYFTS